LLAEGDAWRSHFEVAARHRSVAGDLSGGFFHRGEASSIERSPRAAFDPAKYDATLAIEAKRTQSNPRDTTTLARLGEIEAERDRLDRAKTALGSHCGC